MVSFRVNWQLSFLIVMLSLTPFGCGRTVEDGVVRLQLNWFPDAQHGGYFAAEVHGEYAKQGINAVEILAGGPGSPVIPKLLLGQVDFAIANADQVLLARDQENTDIVTLFAPLQDSPRCIMVHEKSGIQSFTELRDLTLAMGEGKGFAEYLKTKVPLQNVQIVPYSGSVAKFLTHESYAQQGYVFTEPVVARRQGGDPKALMISQLGFNPYTSVLITRRDMVDEKPELVRQFVAAVRTGWIRYVSDGTATNQRILEANPELDSEVLEEATGIVRTLCLSGLPAETHIGAMSEARWRALAGQLKELGLVKSASVDGAFLTDFTN